MKNCLTWLLIVLLLLMGVIVGSIGLDRFMARTQLTRSVAHVNESIATLNKSKARHEDALADFVRAVTEPIAEGIRAQNRQTDARTNQILEQTRGQRIQNDRVALITLGSIAVIGVFVLILLWLLGALLQPGMR